MKLPWRIRKIKYLGLRHSVALFLVWVRYGFRIPDLSELMTRDELERLQERFAHPSESCPNCGTLIRDPDGMCANGPDAGNQYTCPKCVIAFQVPWDKKRPIIIDTLVTAEIRGEL